jgi:hypothetical protein
LAGKAAVADKMKSSHTESLAKIGQSPSEGENLVEEFE